MSKRFILTIDGPTASGKTAVARSVAQRLGIFHLVGGTFFRSFAYYSIVNGLDPHDSNQLAFALKDFRISIEPGGDPTEYSIILNNFAVNDFLWTPEVDAIVSITSSHAPVRAARVAWKREIASNISLIADGRTMGSEVFPDATLKFYLTASLHCRAQRRLDQYISKGRDSLDFRAVKESIARRDESDSTLGELDRTTLYPDQILIDSTNLSRDEVVDSIIELVSRIRQG